MFVTLETSCWHGGAIKTCSLGEVVEDWHLLAWAGPAYPAMYIRDMYGEALGENALRTISQFACGELSVPTNIASSALLARARWYSLRAAHSHDHVYLLIWVNTLCLRSDAVIDVLLPTITQATDIACQASGSQVILPSFAHMTLATCQ